MADPKIRAQRGQVVGTILSSLRDGEKTQLELVAALPTVNPASINASLYSLRKQGRVVIASYRGPHKSAVWKYVDGANRIIITAQERAASPGSIAKRADRVVAEMAAIVEETNALREEIEKLRGENALLRKELKGRLLTALDK